MKKTGVLHAELARTIAAMGHGDLLVIGDAGLPVPSTTRCIDLAVTARIPSFSDVLRAVAEELTIEFMYVAAETSDARTVESIGQVGRPVRSVSHEELKELSARAVAVVRTGEFTPYANVILSAGVAF